MSANISAYFKPLQRQIDELKAEIASLKASIDLLTPPAATIPSHIGGIAKRGRPRKPMRAEYGGTASEKDKL